MKYQLEFLAIISVQCFGNYDVTVLLDRHSPSKFFADPTTKFIGIIEDTIQLLNVQQNKSHFGLLTFKKLHAEVQ